MDDAAEPVQGEFDLIPVADRLRSARLGAGLTIADLAARTRVTQRHLVALEAGDWAALPGRTYVLGFARAYARAVALPEAEIAGQIVAELADIETDHAGAMSGYEPADPARLPTRRLAITVALIGAIVVGALLVWRVVAVGPGPVAAGDGLDPATSARSADPAEPGGEAAERAGDGVGPGGVAAAAGSPAAEGAVVLTALDEVWIGFDDAAGKTENWRTLRPGQPYAVPADYLTQFTLRTSQPNLLKVEVDGRDLGLLGDAPRLTKNIDLRAAALRTRLGGGANAAPALADPIASPR